MRRVAIAVLGLVVLLVAGAGGAILLHERSLAEVSVSSASDGQDFSEIERGRYLTVLADCAACHTSPGGGPFAGGRPIETPFGIVVAPNITPHRDTGIGAWSDAAFDRVLRQGIGRHGRPIYPAMPYTAYTKLSGEDTKAIRAYLATVEPVEHAVVSNRLPFPFSVREAMFAWNALYFTAGTYRPDPGRSDLWNRGAFLVEGPGHCGACHTPRTLLGGDDATRAFQGSVIQRWFAPDITNAARTGLGRWSVDDVTAYLRTGHNRHAAASGPMAEEVSVSSSHMTGADLLAIATFLKDLPGRDVAVPPVPADDPAIRAGAAIYRDRCSACHAPDGRGVQSLIPALAGSAAVQGREPTSGIRVVLQGSDSVATDGEPTAPAMPSFGWQLDDDEIASVLTFIRNGWGNQASPVARSDVARARRDLAKR